MQSFVCPERVARTVRAGQTCKTGVAGATMLTHIFGFLAALIQGVQALVRASRVSWTVGGSQAGNARVFSSTIFAIAVHRLILILAVIPGSKVLQNKIDDFCFSFRNQFFGPFHSANCHVFYFPLL